MAKKRDVYKIGKEKVPSVTQIVGILSKPALVPWAAKMATEHIEKYGLYEGDDDGDSWIVSRAVLDSAKNAHRQRVQDAGAFGSNIHSLVGAYVEGQLTPEGVENLSEKRALENFILTTKNWEWLGSEIVVYNEELKYGGTADAIAKLPDGRTVIVDFKTSTGVYPEHSLQIAMYAYARPLDPFLVPAWEQITDGRILHFNKERLTWESLERDVASHYPFIPHFKKVYDWVNTFSDK